MSDQEHGGEQTELDSDQEAKNPADEAAPSSFRPLRVWPALLLVVGMMILRALPSLIEDGPAYLWMSSAFGPLLCSVLILIWWLAFSRATWRERLLGAVVVFAGLIAVVACLHPTMRGPGTMVMTIPMGFAAMAVMAAVFSRTLSARRTWLLSLAALLGFSVSILFRSDGFWGNFALGLHWRFAPSPEDVMLAAKADGTATQASATSEQLNEWLASPEWPQFRGPAMKGRNGDSVIASTWDPTPPELVWKIPVGPGWSSFAVSGNLLFTLEQRGELETVVCYLADSGEELWTRVNETRFDDPLGGPGPRATPTIADNGLFVLGAKGQLARLDLQTGQEIWSQDLREVADRDVPVWGFSSSPLVVDGKVLVWAGGKGDKGTLAFDARSGELQWSLPAGKDSYSSVQPGVLNGVVVAMMLTNQGIDIIDPSEGTMLLSYEWPFSGYRSLQPQIVNNKQIVIPTGMGMGTRLIEVSIDDEGVWQADEVWTSRRLKSDFNDYVVYDQHLFGFDGTIFTCIELESGDAKWKRGRYGKGQVLLLEASKLLLVAAEKGDLVLLKADRNEHVELGKFKAIDGKSWSHPVVVGDRLYLRNSQEAVCYKLPVTQ